MQDLRATIKLGNGVEMSMQASSSHYCKPRIDGLPIECYTHVEVGVIAPVRHSEDGTALVLPSRLGVGGFDHFFDDCDSPVAGFVPIEVATALLDQLQAATSCPTDLRK